MIATSDGQKGADSITIDNRLLDRQEMMMDEVNGRSRSHLRLL